MCVQKAWMFVITGCTTHPSVSRAITADVLCFRPASFLTVMWGEGSAGAGGNGKRTLTHTEEWEVVYSPLRLTVCPQSPSVIENSAGQTSIPQAFAKQQINILCARPPALEGSGNKCVILFDIIKVSVLVSLEGTNILSWARMQIRKE